MSFDRENRRLRRAAMLTLACAATLTACKPKDAGQTTATTDECVQRRSAEAPPFAMPSLHADSTHGREKVARPDSERVKRGESMLKALCKDGLVPNLTRVVRHPAVPKGNPLIGADLRRGFLTTDSTAQIALRIRAHILPFDSVYRTRRPDGRPLPPDPDGKCDGIVTQGSCYYYGSAAVNRDADGGGMNLTVERPVYDNSGGAGGHSLNEISVQGGANAGNIVEIGWLVSSDQYTDSDPHLFIFHWKNWVPTCYDTCGWTQYSSTYFPGQSLSSLVGKQVYVGYVFYQGNWWAWFDNQWVGYIAGTEWDKQYTLANTIQWFGEVASLNGIPPKTDMGNGAFPSVAAAASMQTLCAVNATDWVCWYRDDQALGATKVTDYDIARTAFGAVRYGGPGQ